MNEDDRVIDVILRIVVVAVAQLLRGLRQLYCCHISLCSVACATSLALASFLTINQTILWNAEAAFVEWIKVACRLLDFLILAVAFLRFEDLVVALAQSVVLLLDLSLSDVGFTLAVVAILCGVICVRL